jgi:hypothetical protein
MEKKIALLIKLTERMLMHVEHGIPPEVDVIAEIRKLIKELRPSFDRDTAS